jgi:hypothetical protein
MKCFEARGRNELGGSEETKCFGKRNGKEEKSGNKGRDCHGDPNLLPSPFDRFNEVAVHFCANSSSFVCDETAEIAGIAIECEDANEASDRRDIRGG